MAAAGSRARPWELRGTVVTRAPAGLALLERDGHQRWCRVNTAVGNGVTLIGVYPTYVLVRDPAGEHKVNFGASIEQGAGRAHSPYTLAVHDLPTLMKKVQLLPFQKNGRVVGYYANQVDKGLRTRIGLRPGDVILAVDGMPLNGDLNVGRLYRTVLSRGGARVEVRRRGRTLNLEYRLH